MKLKLNKKVYRNIALVLSLLAVILWSVLGTGTSLAWFVDTSPEMNNIFHFAEFDLKVSHLVGDDWKEIDAQTEVFDEEALYEPGYVQVVYLKVENLGTVPFDFYTAVNVNGCIWGVNGLNQKIYLQDYLRFGITINDTQEQMKSSVADRETAKAVAQSPLSNYATDPAPLAAGGEVYIALVVRMPEEVSNVANYRGDTVPTVELGITVKADQIV